MNELQIDENKEYIETCFQEIFRKINYQLKSVDMNYIVYGNEYSELIFGYDMQQYGRMIFMNLNYKNSKTKIQFSVQRVLDYLFKIDTKKIIEDYHQKRTTEEKAYALLIEKYMLDIIINNDFLWEEELKYKIENNK